jgi:hypothetical protein
MISDKRINSLVEAANKRCAKGDFKGAESVLTRCAKMCGISNSQKEPICERLAALLCEQGLFASAASWYQQVLQFKSERLDASDPEVKAAERNYCILLVLSEHSGMTNLIDLPRSYAKCL